MADEQSKPPAPPPPSAPPPTAPPKSVPPSKKPAPKARPKPRRKPPGKPKGRKGKRPAPRKSKPGQPPVGEKKGRRIKIKLGLRANRISEDVDTYTDQIGWTTSSSETVLSDLKDAEEIVKKEPDTLMHHCSMCGSRMEIPKPKRDRYKVICAHPECGHEDNIGL
ncbi:MAG: hypothetical protein CMA88_00250 [Euryarchaeota archaeon]|nr:hypothetical protein [Euryarchaeota archaeon]